jgi:hypothetical protein
MERVTCIGSHTTTITGAYPASTGRAIDRRRTVGRTFWSTEPSAKVPLRAVSTAFGRRDCRVASVGSKACDFTGDAALALET